MYSVVTLILHWGWVACLTQEHKSISCFYRFPFGKPQSSNNACSVFVRLAQPFHHFHNISEHLQVLYIIDPNTPTHTHTHTQKATWTSGLWMPIKRERFVNPRNLSASEKKREGMRWVTAALNLGLKHPPSVSNKRRQSLSLSFSSPNPQILRFGTKCKWEIVNHIFNKGEAETTVWWELWTRVSMTHTKWHWMKRLGVQRCQHTLTRFWIQRIQGIRSRLCDYMNKGADDGPW